MEGFGWEPRSMPLAGQLTGTLSALLDEQLQQWSLSNTELDNTLQQQEALVDALVNDVESALAEERQKRHSIAQTLDSAKKFVEARRIGPAEFDELFERLESIGAIVDNDFEEDEANDPTESLFRHVASAGEKCGQVHGSLITSCRLRFRKMNLSPEELFNRIDADRSGYVEQEEFIAVVKQLDIGHIEALFKQHDKDESGYLNAAEIRQLAKQLGKVLTAAELTAAVSEMDPSGDGQVDLNEFVLWWRKQSETDSGGVLGDALSSHASALDQEYRWFFAAVDSGDEESDGKISLREFSSFVWAWERQTEYRIGDLVIVWPPSAADPAVYSAQTKGKSGVETPDWQPAVGAAEEDGASTVKDGELTWVKQTEHARRLGALCREPT